MKLFISGPMRGVSPCYGFYRFDEARDELKAKGYEVVSPADLDREQGFDPTRWGQHGTFWKLAEKSGWQWLPAVFDLEAAMQRDLEALRKCDGVAMLLGWSDSAGARREVEEARKHNIASRSLTWWLENRYLFARPPENVIIDEKVPPEMMEVSPRAALLREAERLVCGDRNAQYGSPVQDFTRTAAILNAMGYRGTDCESGEGRNLLPHDVALIMSCLKLSRLAWSPDKKDSWTDLAGYAACGWQCVFDGSANG